MTIGKTLKRYRGWIAVVAILAIAGVAFAVTRAGGDKAEAPSYTTEAAEKGTLSVTVDGTGNLAVRDEVSAYPIVSGTVAKVYVDEGDKVSEGDVLYELTSTSADKEVASAKAAKQQASVSLKKAQLDLYKAKTELSSLEDRSDDPSSTVTSSDIKIAKKEITIAQASVDSAELSLSAASASYTDAVDALDDLEVTAPCDGLVWTVSVEKGDSVSTGGASSTSSSSGGGESGSGTTTSSSSSAPVTIAKDSQLGVELTINEVDITTLAEGQDAEIAFDAVTDLQMTGTVDEIAREGSVSSGVVSYSVWLNLDGTDKRLKTGMTASATIVSQVERDVLLVSNSAVKSATDGTSYVQVMDAGATAPRDVTVETGLSNATQTVIVSGISEGTQVVTKTTSTASASSSSEDDSEDQGGGMMMMGGTPPSGGPPAGGAPGGQ